MQQIIGDLFLRGINNKFWDDTFFILSARVDSLPALEATKQRVSLFYIELWMDKTQLRTLLEMMKRRRAFREKARKKKRHTKVGEGAAQKPQ